MVFVSGGEGEDVIEGVEVYVLCFFFVCDSWVELFR